jgi:F-type H+-transporting ATPase subunit b
MANDLSHTTSGTVQPPVHKSGLPQLDFATYSSQLFWLVVTFALLLIVMWRVVAPRIGGGLADRKNRIASELERAQTDRGEAERAWSTYQNTLVEARQRARAVTEENRVKVTTETERAEAVADETAQAQIAKAEAELARLRAEAKGSILAAAQDAAIDIVARLTGEKVGADEAAAAVREAQG